MVITGCDSMERLDQAVRVARSFEPMTAEEQRDVLDRVAADATSGRFERYKTTDAHDGTAAHPEWLGVSEHAG